MILQYLFKKELDFVFNQPGIMPYYARLDKFFKTICRFDVAKSIGERELAAQHLLNVMPGDLILLDRGYPAWWLFSLILSMQADSCAE